MSEPKVEKLDLRSHDVARDWGQDLLRLFPEIRTEGGKVVSPPLYYGAYS